MKFKELAEYLQKLESTASRIEMTKILAGVFKQASPEDAQIIAYLSAGKLGPPYANPDMGVADKMMLRALGDKALDLFKKLGDLGLVAQEVSKGKGDLSIKEVHEKLVEIATASGSGSQEKKQVLIRDLMSNLDSLSAKYTTRIILSKLRVGFSDMTVLDSLSWMVKGDKSLRPEIERMYNVRADLGEIAKKIRSNPKPEKIAPKIGIPILMARAERATSAGQIWGRNGRCAAEYKLDGLRIQAHVAGDKVLLFSRGLEDVSSMYPEVVAGLKKYLKKPAIVEGEMIALTKDGKFLPFQETMQRKRKYDIESMSGKIPLTIYLFDALVVDGKSIMDEPNEKRRAVLENIVAEGGGTVPVLLMTRTIVESVTDIERFFKRALQDGTEGIIAKRLQGPYQAGARDFNWIKYKKSYDQSALADTVDAVVMGYDVGQGKRVGFGIGDFLIGVYDATADCYLTIAKIGTGLSDEEWRRMKKEIDAIKAPERPSNYEVKKEMSVDVWAKPKIVVEVQADEITKSPMHSSSYALRFPRLISWREKQPREATSTTELSRLYDLQKK